MDLCWECLWVYRYSTPPSAYVGNTYCVWSPFQPLTSSAFHKMWLTGDWKILLNMLTIFSKTKLYFLSLALSWKSFVFSFLFKPHLRVFLRFQTVRNRGLRNCLFRAEELMCASHCRWASLVCRHKPALSGPRYEWSARGHSLQATPSTSGF